MEENEIAANYHRAKRLTSVVAIIVAPCLTLIGGVGYVLQHPGEQSSVMLIGAGAVMLVLIYKVAYQILDRFFPLPLLYMEHRSKEIPPEVALDCVVRFDNDQLRDFAFGLLLASAKKDPTGVQALADLAHDIRIPKRLRMQAVSFLGEVGERGYDHVPRLISLLSSEDEDCRAQSLKSLRKITGKDFQKNPDLWERWWQSKRSG